MKIRLLGQANDSGIGTHNGEIASGLSTIRGVNSHV